MNRDLKKLMRHGNGRSLLLIVLSVLGLLLGALLLMVSGGETAKPDDAMEFIGVDEDESQYSYLDVAYLSYPIASYASNENHQFCLAEDMQGLIYVVCLDGSRAEEYQALLDYTYGESSVDPGLMTFYGYPTPMEEDLYTYVAEGGNLFWDTDFLTEDNVEEYFGDYFLDTTKTAAGSDRMAGNTGGILVLVCAVVLFATLRGRKKRKQQTKRTMQQENASCDIEQISSQMESGGYTMDKPSCTCVTGRYMVSGRDGFDYVDLENCRLIRRVSFHDSLSPQTALELTDRMGGIHRMAVMKDTPVSRERQQMMVSGILSRYPELPFEEQTAGENGVAGESGFAGETAESIGGGRRVLGIIGAIGGAAIGGVLWVLIGELGFIAGIAGLAMVMLAMRGYRLLAGGLDRTGAITALILAFLLIIPANLVSSLWAIYQAFAYDGAGSVTLGQVIGHAGYYMSEFEQWGSFLANLVVGYLLSLWASWSVIRNLIRKK